MRLLYFDNRGELSLTEDLIHKIPPYAILSHTWLPDEVTFSDLQNGDYKSKAGYTKIHFCGQQAQRDGIDHFWVDTCCIDKTNHSELAEAIASMFRWYSDAVKCYVFLSDVQARKRDHDGTQSQWQSAVRRSRWFTRGWTLQELLAPDSVEFFSREGDRLGDKTTLEQMINEITKIPREALCGHPLEQFPVSERFRWTEGRSTTRAEDRAYCLLGIFNVFIAPIYGEGDNAFDRLKDEISRSYRRQLDGIGRPSLTSRPLHTETHGVESISTSVEKTSLCDRREKLFTSLAFEQMDSRRATIKAAHSTTCQWLLEHSAYLDWLDPGQAHQHRGFLWIDGKPGAGKSTLIKFAYARAAKGRPEDEILISFFFNARGDEFERSTIGLYRALLHQLLIQAPDLQTLLDDLYPIFENQAETSIWTIESLSELFTAAVSRLGDRRLKCFIDALDECDEQQVQEMVYFFEELGQCAIDSGSRLNICFASRHYPTIDIQNCRKLTLEDETGHRQDLVKYIQNHLRAGKGPYIEKVREQVLEKANGIFMWAVLVVDILNKEFRRGSVFTVARKLQEVPDKLSDLFKDILRRDDTNMDELLLCLQWLLFAKRPLTREEFYFAMAAGSDADCKNITQWDIESVNAGDMGRFVLNSSKGLVELTKSKAPTVQFIHESVRDFLIKDDGLRQLWPELGDDIYSLSHDQLKRCCQRYLNVNVSACVPPHPLPKWSSDSAKEMRLALPAKFPFIKYAHDYILYHAEEAADKLPQDNFLRSWAKETWINIGNVFAKGDINRHNMSTSLLYLLAEYGYPRLIRTHCDQGAETGAQTERYRYPLFAALAHSHRLAVKALLSIDEDSPAEDFIARLECGKTFSTRKDDTPLYWAIARGHERLAEILVASEFSHDNVKGQDGRNVLNLAIKNGFESMVRQLITVHKVSVNPTLGNIQHAPLVCAAGEGKIGIVRNLILWGADLQVMDGSGKIALHQAAAGGHTEVVQLLVDEGADIKDVDTFDNTALHLAATNGCTSVVQVLLNASSTIEAGNIDQQTALHLAAANGREASVQLLIDSGADIEATDSLRQSPLHLAAVGGHEKTVQMLLENDAQVEVVDASQRTALHCAARSGHYKTAQLLLDRGANIESIDATLSTALHLASFRGDSVTVHSLLDMGANIDARDRDGRTPLSIAAEQCNVLVLHLLLAARADYNARDNTGRTPLSWAIGFIGSYLMELSSSYHPLQDYQMQLMLLEQQNKRRLMKMQLMLLEQQNKRRLMMARDPDGGEGPLESSVKLLLSYGADTEIVDNHGKTALHWAREKGLTNVVQLLEASRVNTSLNREQEDSGSRVSPGITSDAQPSPAQ